MAISATYALGSLALAGKAALGAVAVGPAAAGAVAIGRDVIGEGASRADLAAWLGRNMPLLLRFFLIRP